MLNCVYHPYHPTRVVEDSERDELIASGEWFDHPLKASAERTRLEELKNASSLAKSKPKKEKKNEKIDAK